MYDNENKYGERKYREIALAYASAFCVRTHCQIFFSLRIESRIRVAVRHVLCVTLDYCLAARQSERLIAVFVRGVIDEKRTLVQIVPESTLDPITYNIAPIIASER